MTDNYFKNNLGRSVVCGILLLYELFSMYAADSHSYDLNSFTGSVPPFQASLWGESELTYGIIIGFIVLISSGGGYLYTLIRERNRLSEELRLRTTELERAEAQLEKMKRLLQDGRDVRQESNESESKTQLVFDAKSSDYTSNDEKFLKQAVACVNRHLSDADFDLSLFLEEMHTTKSTCFRKLKSLTGMTFVSFLRSIRMKAACRIMEDKRQIGIAELAYAVGYNDPRYFSSSFKKEMGITPSEYMERFTQGGVLSE